MVTGIGEDPADVRRVIGEEIPRIRVLPGAMFEANGESVDAARSIGVDEAAEKLSREFNDDLLLPVGQFDLAFMLLARAGLGEDFKPASVVNRKSDTGGVRPKISPDLRTENAFHGIRAFGYYAGVPRIEVKVEADGGRSVTGDGAIPEVNAEKIRVSLDVSWLAVCWKEGTHEHMFAKHPDVAA